MKKPVLLALAAIMLFGVAGAAFADSATYTNNTPPLASTTAAPVTVSATVNPKISLTVTTPDVGQTVAYGAVDPGATYGGKTVNLVVNSNKRFDLTAVQNTTSFGTLTLTRSFANALGNAKGINVAFADNYSITVPADADPLPYTATVTYSVVQLP